MEMLKPGVYVLTREVQNPEPDRRCRYNWSAVPSWPAGSRWHVRASEYVENSVDVRPLTSVTPMPDRDRYQPAWMPHVKALAPALVPVEALWREVLRVSHHDAIDVLGVLFDQKRLTIEDLNQILLDLDVDYE